MYSNVSMMDTKNHRTSKLKLKSTQIFIVAGTVLITLVISVVCIGLTVRYEVDTDAADTGSIGYWKMNLPPEQEEWFEKGIADLRLASKGAKHSRGNVKNVLIFMADGVTTDMLAKARFSGPGNVTDFVWDSFPHLGILKSSCGFSSNCDVFSLGTALFGGVKTKTGLGGLDRRVDLEDCHQALNETFQVPSILEQAQEANLRTGFITTKRVTSPPLSALYAHSPDTRWECDAAMPKDKRLQPDCLDVATQLMTGDTGHKINVIMGGGKQTLISRLPNDTDVDVSACDSKDKRNLLHDWKSLKFTLELESSAKYKLLESIKDLDKFTGATRDYVLGVFANGDLLPGQPKLEKMFTKSLEVLERPKTGYVFVVETAVKGQRVEDFRGTLLELDDVVKANLARPGFSAQSTLVLVAFMDFTKSPTDSVASEDILVFATGPNSHLFHSIHEETYMAHVIGYSLKIGPFQIKKPKKKSN